MCGGPESDAAKAMGAPGHEPETVDADEVEDGVTGDSTADPVTGVITPVSLDYINAASPEESAFYRAIAEGRIVGQRCPTCDKVYVPPRAG